MLKELKSRAGGKGNSVPFTVAQVRTKFKKCISECKKAALKIKTATGVKRFQDDKNYGVWFDRLFELVKTRDSCRQPRLQRKCCIRKYQGRYKKGTHFLANFGEIVLVLDLIHANCRGSHS